MKIILNNLGPIKAGEIELGQLTIVAGGNNTGKTYLTYALYGLFRYLHQEFAFADLLRPMTRQLRETGKAEIKFSSADLVEEIRTTIANFDAEALARVFSADSDYFEGAAFNLIEGTPNFFEGAQTKLTASIKTRAGEVSVVLNYSPKSLAFTLNAQFSGEYSKLVGTSALMQLRRQIGRVLTKALLPSIVPEPFISTSERLGIALFYKDLDSSRNALVEQLQRMALAEGNARSRLDPWKLVDSATSRFALPIHDNINFVRDLDSVQKNTNQLDGISPDEYIVQMMGGGYRKEGEQILFSNNRRGANRLRFPIHLGSSSIRSLADIFFYLRHAAKRHSLLMIDEPESHLTPQNQVVLARMLGAIVSSGVRVYVTTHSDYLVKELNNLIMLNELSQTKRARACAEYGYKEHEAIPKSSVRGYMCDKGSIIPCKVTEFGVEVPTLDAAVEALNDRSMFLFDAVGERS